LNRQTHKAEVSPDARNYEQQKSSTYENRGSRTAFIARSRNFKKTGNSRKKLDKRKEGALYHEGQFTYYTSRERKEIHVSIPIERGEQ